MSFYPQPNSYACGPFALKYALVMLGQFQHEDDIGRKAGSTWWYGTDEIGLAKAARRFNCTMKYFSDTNGKQALLKLRRFLKAGLPCILSVDNWNHWFTILREERNKYVVVDSTQQKVIVIYSEAQLLERWIYTDENTKAISFDGYALTPDYKVKTRGIFNLERARYVMKERNSLLALKWNSYFNDLISICKPLTPNAKKAITFTEFLRRNESLIVKEVANWHGTPSYAELKHVLDNFKFVAETYQLHIYVKDQKKAFIDLTCILMMYACGKYGMKDMYI
ncbi:MAG: hypothetical protein HYV28_17995 [Ignavibacteriales bacterium]|nr:hypothetical protein [Ignavibacteriales bacterium]